MKVQTLHRTKILNKDCNLNIFLFRLARQAVAKSVYEETIQTPTNDHWWRQPKWQAMRTHLQVR